MNKRTSFLESEFRAEEQEDKLIVEGYFIKYGEETNLFGNVFEEVDARSVVKSLEKNDIRGLFNHDSSLVLGRTGNKTLTLRSDDVGLWGSIEINKDDPGAMGAYARIKRGDVAGCSFGFYPLKEDRETRAEGGEKFIIREMDLFEVSPCVFPAYPQTEIAARQKHIDAIKQEKLNIRKQKLKELLNK
ncbi:HK97 family phage prohead protease [Metabacillus dongyingensis]|uniref:HK97 family phage prohead protease n=1 Tax=Metabacillus dongyingensis TaxID=2874282 RepID=UPI003B8BF6A7